MALNLCLVQGPPYQKVDVLSEAAAIDKKDTSEYLVLLGTDSIISN